MCYSECAIQMTMGNFPAVARHRPQMSQTETGLKKEEM